VSGIAEPLEDDFDDESSRLNEGLKNCRSVVNDYRAMLAGDPAFLPIERSDEASSD
jgi:hypothetical protein